MEVAEESASGAASATQCRGAPIVLYDGVCGFCNGAIRFVWRRDPVGRFRFAPLQSRFAREVLSRHQRDPTHIDTMYVIVDYDEPAERLLAKADGIFYVLQELGGIWRLGGLMRVLPDRLLDRVYDFIVGHRYSLFGKYDHCPLPDAGVRERFLDVEE